MDGSGKGKGGVGGGFHSSARWMAEGCVLPVQGGWRRGVWLQCKVDGERGWGAYSARWIAEGGGGASSARWMAGVGGRGRGGGVPVQGGMRGWSKAAVW